MRREQPRLCKENFEDRLVGTIKDTYKPDQIPIIVRGLWRHRANKEDMLKTKALTTKRESHTALRTSVDFLMGNYILLQGDEWLQIEAGDLCYMVLNGEGLSLYDYPFKFMLFNLFMGKGKMRQEGGIAFVGSL